MPACRSLIFLLSAFGALGALADETEQPLTPIEAHRKIGETVFVEVTVKAAKDRLEKRGEIYLDCEEDFRDAKNLATVITREGAGDLRRHGIADPAEHFRGKRIRVRGVVVIKEERPRIEVNEARQIAVVEDK